MTDGNDGPSRTDTSGDDRTPRLAKQVSLGVTLGRAAALRCPRCGNGKQFRNLFQMHPRCSDCALRFERGPGYFLGSAYINYGLTCAIMTLSYFILHFGFGWSNRQLAPGLVAFCVVFPLFFFRYARSFWMGLDYWFDPTGFAQEHE